MIHNKNPPRWCFQPNEQKIAIREKALPAKLPTKESARKMQRILHASSILNRRSRRKFNTLTGHYYCITRVKDTCTISAYEIFGNKKFGKQKDKISPAPL